MYQQVRVISHIDHVIDASCCQENFSAFMYNESLKSYIWNLGSSPTGTTSCMKVVPCMMVICFLKKLPHKFLLRPVSPQLSVMGETIFY